MPETREWLHLTARNLPVQGSGIDVVMPIYRGHAETLRAIQRVLAARNRHAFRLVLINDASPDTQLSAAIAELSAHGLVLALSNPTNLGFVGTANRGMRLSATQDVVLLNADTEVFDGWLDRLRAASYRDMRTATATPLSNAATILSYPFANRENTEWLELSAQDLDRLAMVQAAEPIEIPTAIGFCMYIRRACLDQIGGFDEAAFGRGYGEENDFCMRAAADGWRHVAATDTFVWHWGARSFGTDRAQRLKGALARLRTLHPDYLPLVADFIRRDPIAPVRAALDRERVLRHARRHWLVLGREPDDDEVPTDCGILQLLPQGRFGKRWQFLHPDLGPIPNLPLLDLSAPLEASVRLLRSLGVERVLVRSQAARWIDPHRRLAELAQRLGTDPIS